MGLFIGAPFLSEYDGEPSVPMSRRWNKPDGSFGGVVVQTIKLAVPYGLFSSFKLSQDSGVYILLTDGTILTRFPLASAGIGASIARTEGYRYFVSKREGSFVGVGGLEPAESLHVYRTLENFPVVISVFQSRDSILNDWKRNALWLATATLVLMAACVLLALQAQKGMEAYRQAARRLAKAERELRTVVSNLPVLVAYWDDRLVNRMANITHLDWLGWSPEAMNGKHVAEVLGDTVYKTISPHLQAALAGEVRRFECEFPDVDGNSRHAIVSYIPDWDEGRVKGFFATATDISERKAAETALFEEKERFRVILESIHDGVITTNAKGQILYLNPAAARMTGWELAQAKGRHIEEVLRVEMPDRPGKGLSILDEVLVTQRPLESRIEQVLNSRSGQRVSIENWAAPIQDEQGRLRAVVVVFHEIGQVREMAKRMAHLAQHDALTGLPNRRSLDEAGALALAQAQIDRRELAVLYLDLDGFKQVNDEHGHAVGDELLIAITRRLSRQLRSTDRLYRQGGDEFVVLMSSITSASEAEQLALRLITCCQSPVSTSAGHFSVTVSIGLAVYPTDSAELGDLIQKADRGMYAAKNAGRNCYVPWSPALKSAQGHHVLPL